ncbi:unnamed protein product [Closterium sp. NIES-65]|nr:unnamed protein product [Closterium sp. NIES-65]
MVVRGFGGVWVAGVWVAGVWVAGVWVAGVWVAGVWVAGVWVAGVWVAGVWVAGVWVAGVWVAGVWVAGVWVAGVWVAGVWVAGVWVAGVWVAGVSDVAHQQEVVATLKNTLATGNLPHLLFYGPPGTGKTSTALAITKELFGQDVRSAGNPITKKHFGPELYSSQVLELNASDDRGISAVRHTPRSATHTTTFLSIRSIPSVAPPPLPRACFNIPSVAPPPLPSPELYPSPSPVLEMNASDDRRRGISVLYSSRVLELNASDDRGISVVRTKIKDFAGVAVGHGVR